MKVVADETGVTVVNIASRRRLEWAEILQVNLRPGDPWVFLNLSDGTSLPALGIQPGVAKERAISRERLGAAARARALELFTVEQNITAFSSIYLEIVSHCPVRRVVLDAAGEPLPFGVPAEAHVPGRWTGPTARVVSRGGPGWALGAPARPAPVRATPLAAPEGAL
ncbi:PH domain-containing protein [Streptomyces sp. NPDC005921]